MESISIVFRKTGGCYDFYVIQLIQCLTLNKCWNNLKCFIVFKYVVKKQNNWLKPNF